MMKITVVRSVLWIRTTLIFERRFCHIGLIPDAGNYEIFPLKKAKVTTQVSPIIPISHKKEQKKGLILLVES